jgi:dienelactone hydrolase
MLLFVSSASRQLSQASRRAAAAAPGVTSPSEATGASAAGRAVYLSEGAGPVFGFLHSPASKRAMATGVLLCPPFGWEEICSYRSRRDWASDLARAGFPALRIDLPGSGDSGGSPHDPEQLSAWTAAIASAAALLREVGGVRRVAAIGIGLGGVVLCRALAQDAPVDDAVLWAVPARGRALVRELRAFASLEESALGAVADSALEPPPLPDGSVWAGGFVLSAQTVAELEHLDVSASPLPEGRLRRALMLGRDGVAVDQRLRAHLERSGARVTVDAGNGYGAMMAQPHEARAPYGVFETVRGWLAEADGQSSAEAPQAPDVDGGSLAQAPAMVELSVGGVAIRETAVEIPDPHARLFGILAEPAERRSELCGVFLNAGAIRRIGPNRMWVEAARRWTARGVTTLRLDVEGIGDAGGDSERLSRLAELYAPTLVAQVRSALDALEARGVAKRFVLVGLCSGACWSFHSALTDERVLGAFMLNPQALFWDESLEASRALRRGVLRTSSWGKLLRRQVPLERVGDLLWRAPFALPRRALSRRSARRRGESELAEAFDRLRDGDKALRFIFSGNEPLCEELELEGFIAELDRWPNVSIERISGQIHTLRPFQAQVGAHEALDRALGELLARIPKVAPSASAPSDG